MDSVNNKYIDKIRSIVLDFFADFPAEVYLFGSWARGTQRRGSDVDIAIECGDAQAERKIAELREIFEESTIPYRVDLVDMRQAAESLREEIRREGVRWRQ